MTGLEWLLDPDLDDDELNRLFADSWPDHEDREYGRIHARSLARVAVRDGARLVGYVNVAGDGGDHAFLLDPTVLPAYRRRGIGRGLLDRAAEAARAAGATWLHVDFVPELEPFYRAAGYRPTAAGLLRLEGRGNPDPENPVSSA